MISFVIGPPCSGKTTFITGAFNDALVIDLFRYQKPPMTLEMVLQSQEDAKDALIKAVKKGENVVFEHTLLKRERRQYYINAIREVTNEPIICYVMKPSFETYKKFCRKRGVQPDSLEFRMLQEPTLSEGFDRIYLVTPKEK